jgi:hypothetical protein
LNKKPWGNPPTVIYFHKKKLQCTHIYKIQKTQIRRTRTNLRKCVNSHWQIFGSGFLHSMHMLSEIMNKGTFPIFERRLHPLKDCIVSFPPNVLACNKNHFRKFRKEGLLKSLPNVLACNKNHLQKRRCNKISFSIAFNRAQVICKWFQILSLNLQWKNRCCQSSVVPMLHIEQVKKMFVTLHFLCRSISLVFRQSLISSQMKNLILKMHLPFQIQEYIGQAIWSLERWW